MERAKETIRWRIELMGGLRVVRDERPFASFETQQAALLLAYVAFYRDRCHTRETLIELLWPGCEARAGRNRLSVSLSWLRRRLGHREQEAGDPILQADRASVAVAGPELHEAEVVSVA